jgi:hypothetical protein
MSSCQGFERDCRTAVRTLGHIRSRMCVQVTWVIFYSISCHRFDFYDIPAVFLGFLQGTFVGVAVLLENVERKRRFVGRFRTSRGPDSEPVRDSSLLLQIPSVNDADILRVVVALRRENVRPWHEVEQDFLESDYQAVRDRQMKELEEEDDLLSKIPVRYGGLYLYYAPP